MLRSTANTLVMIAATACASPVVAGKGTKTVHMVKVEDITFRVLVEGHYAKVASKGSAWFAPVGARYFALARRAAEQASGCKVTETDNFRATLYVSLDCNNRIETKPL